MVQYNMAFLRTTYDETCWNGYIFLGDTCDTDAKKKKNQIKKPHSS